MTARSWNEPAGTKRDPEAKSGWGVPRNMRRDQRRDRDPLVSQFDWYNQSVGRHIRSKSTVDLRAPMWSDFGIAIVNM